MVIDGAVQMASATAGINSVRNKPVVVFLKWDIAVSCCRAVCPVPFSGKKSRVANTIKIFRRPGCLRETL